MGRERFAEGTSGQTFRRAAREAVGTVVRAGAGLYDRTRDLPRLIRATPDELDGDGAMPRPDIVERLERALAAERRRGRARRWTYDLGRHIALMQALSAERTTGGAPRKHPECAQPGD